MLFFASIGFIYFLFSWFLQIERKKIHSWMGGGGKDLEGDGKGENMIKIDCMKKSITA